ncbi:DnaK7 protein [Candidatus Vecturithrix granuli]|uniref:DnaK7 protein n=1 Tax=Vecturithrix granuli TaxID=1499967 RepID=A0A081C0Z7_VECG1|nr:DnaK7 protein [Candidatus Vecturithrix granuli]
MSGDSEKNPVLGFDLGTTFSALARWIDGRGPRIIQNKTGQDTTQSVVYYNPEKDEYIVGQIAYRRGLITPENMIVGVKRLMDDANQKVLLGGKEFNPVDISAIILEKIYEDAKSKFPKGVFSSRGSVVTVPFYFKAHQIENTRTAAERANINCIGIIQEPIAASLCYAYQLSEEYPEKEFSENILVFDLGGGTFDLTLFRLEQTKKSLNFEVLGTGGDDRLGGMDFDACFADLILKKNQLSLDGLTPIQFNQSRQKLMEATIDAKKTLSSTTECWVSVPFIIPPDKNIDCEMTREEFETSIQLHVRKIKEIIQNLWKKSGIKPSQVDRIIRVGGSSAIPCMKALLDDVIGESKVWSNANPSTSIAEGAAMYAAYLDNRGFFDKDIVIYTRTCHALGIKTVKREGRNFKELIPANHRTPCKVKQVFTTYQDNVPFLDIDIYQGAGPVIRRDTHSHIGTISITDLPPRPAGKLDVEVTFKIDEEQMLSVTVVAEGQQKSAILNYT